MLLRMLFSPFDELKAPRRWRGDLWTTKKATGMLPMAFDPDAERELVSFPEATGRRRTRGRRGGRDDSSRRFEGTPDCAGLARHNFTLREGKR